MITPDKKSMEKLGGATIATSAESVQTKPLLDMIQQATTGNSTITFVGSAAGEAEGGSLTLTWEELHKDALAMAARLQKQGVLPGEHLALLGPTTRSLVTAIQAAWLAGASVSMLPIPMRFSSVEEFARQTRALMKYGNINYLLLDPALAAFYEYQVGDPAVLLLDQLAVESCHTSISDYRPVERDPHRLAVLQFTSGSTSDPKGVMLPYHTLEANLAGMIVAAEIVTEDVFVSWLPLYHDMGLIGLLSVPMVSGSSLVLAAPQDFLSRPADWMRWMHQYRGTLTCGPNFSWVLAARAFRRMTATGEMLDLSRVRIALNGAEPVDPDVVEALIEVAEPHCFRREAVFCAFGMAELALGGTFPPPLRGPVNDTVDREALENKKVAIPADPGQDTSRRFPLLGTPIPGLEMRIRDLESGELLQAREVGELEIRGSSVMTGYYERPDLNRELFENGWLKTGDLAYFAAGPDGKSQELVICGRKKDVIIIAGRNIFPEDIERTAGAVDGVRAGNVIAFGVEGSKRKETIVVVAEVRNGNLAEVKSAIRERVIGLIGYPPRDIVLVQPGTLPKTSSGKLQRSLCRRQYLGGDLSKVE